LNRNVRNISGSEKDGLKKETGASFIKLFLLKFNALLRQLALMKILQNVI